jgi:MFS family permease
MKSITRTVWILSFVSLFTDVASEMLYPIMPVYLKSIHFSVWLIGLLEGIAEATTGLGKGYFGKLSDERGQRLPFVRLGYFLSGISKPLLPLSVFPLWVFMARTLDRLGKGIRTGARDAMLSDEATPGTKGKVFGFHRSMDTLGAVLGPAFALLYLYFYPEQYKTLFFIAFIPGVLAFSASLLLKENAVAKTSVRKVSFFAFLQYWKNSNADYKKLVGGLLFFTLFNSSDVFLLLRVKESGASDTNLIAMYIFYNLVYALFAFPAGIVADKVGLKKIFLTGLVVFAGVYFGMGVATEAWMFYVLFLFYGLFMAFTEGITKAWISNISDKKDTATAIGTYTAFQSVCTMMASAVAGLIWFRFGAASTFFLTAIATIAILIYMSAAVKSPSGK